MKSLRFIALLIFGISSALAEESDVIARAGETEIRVADIQTSLSTLDARQLVAVRENPSLLEQVVRSFIAQRLILQKALDEQWDKDEAVVAKLQRARDSTLTESYIESQSRPAAHFPDEEELKAAYEQRKAALLIPRSYRLAQLFVPVAAGSKASKEVKAQAKQTIETQRKRGETFTELGWLAENQIQPEIRTHLPIWRAGKAAVSEPVWLNDGWHLFQILDVREARTPALDEVRAQLRQTLRQERQRENSQAWLANFLKQHPVKLHSEALSRTLPESSP